MVVLHLGSAVAVLCSKVGAGRDVHDWTATEALRAATGRSDIVIERRPSGRPRLLPPYPELAVSLSYRDGLLLAGFDTAGPVGVDLEPAPMAGAVNAIRLASDHFAPGEAAAVAARPPEQAVDLFFRLWVAKEAVLKLTGRGVYDGMHLPDLGGSIADLLGDGRAIRLAASSAHPPLEIAVSRPLSRYGCPAPYCAMARAGVGDAAT